MMIAKEIAMITSTIPEQQTTSHQDAQYQNADYSATTLTLDDLEFAELHRQYVCSDFPSE